MKRYLCHLFTAIFLPLIVAVAVNWLADPYAIFGAPVLMGVNQAKPAIATNGRIFKMAGYARQPMDALILGTSRADSGLSPKHEAFQNQHALNLAMAAQSNNETALVFKFVARRSPLKTAVIGLDFFASNAYLTYTPDFSPDNFTEDRKWKLLFSLDTLLASKKTLFQDGRPPRKPDEARLNSGKKFNRQTFIASEKGYMWGGTYLPGPKCRYRFEADNIDNGQMHRNKPLEAIRSMIALGHQRHIGLYLFISPSHARQWETLAAVGLWDQWEEWKRRLVRSNEEEAQRAGRPPFPLWDFSGYHRISTEALPPEAGSPAEMYGYVESSHYKPVVGDLLLDRMFGLKIPGRAAPDDFGVLLSSDNIETQLAQIRLDRIRYRQRHPEDIAEIAAAAAEVRQDNNCISEAKPVFADAGN